ncbi:penicillin-binding protein 2 [Haloechinothrix sp. LS1_15]|uniref:peptidoglycan D,D-transpeptidase FtsI family protein n=1 Tax=Haloechinothrix sp. LS1_15 TaxID=2652248 RepID=UPI0029469A20|nr:penicillin-binding protein 2 [Haloechinothrix sp. LS1_15]MDV6012178.1 penicillin-binding protein 2 [Haloechinothrix sp. LS1_15]
MRGGSGRGKQPGRRPGARPGRSGKQAQRIAAKNVGRKRGQAKRQPAARGRLTRRVGAGAARCARVNRFQVVSVLLVVVLGITALKLVHVQAFQAEALSEQAERQRTTVMNIPAQRGSIFDRDGIELAFSVETRTLQVNLRSLRREWAEHARENPESDEDFDTRITEISEYIAERVPELTSKEELLAKFRKPANFTFLVDDVPPSVAEEVTERYPEIAKEQRAHREYPSGRVAADVVGYASWLMEDEDVSKHNLHGRVGLENLRDDDLAGRPGQQLVDTRQGDPSVVIPGSERDVQPAVAGSDLHLTLDSDVQHDLQERLSDYVERTDANGGSAVVMDAETAEVYALANDSTFDPSDFSNATNEQLNNAAVTTPFEPGSVNKIVTAAAAIEEGITDPDEVHSVPGSIQVADHTVRDAWSHGVIGMTTTGIFAKSSNVGTLQLAQELGEESFAEMLERFGLGRRTGIGLPGESPGYVPALEEWSGTTFGNLPIGQGLSMTVVQMASMYQVLANEGVRVEPRVVRYTVDPDGERVPEPEAETSRVVSPETADTVLDMLRATIQDGPGQDSGTAPMAAIDGYQISGKTGSAQQVNPATGAYSQSLFNITFAGAVPADNPQFVIAIMLDAPDTTIPEGSSAAPLFRDVASYLMQRYQVPLSSEEAPVVPLVVD